MYLYASPTVPTHKPASKARNERTFIGQVPMVNARPHAALLHSCFFLKQASYDKCIGDDTKAAACKSPNCVKKTKK